MLKHRGYTLASRSKFWLRPRNRWPRDHNDTLASALKFWPRPRNSATHDGG